MSRVVSVWLPRFVTDRLNRAAARQQQSWSSSTRSSRSRPSRGAVPLITAVSIQGGIRVAAVDALAEEAGIIPGITLADARVLVPGLTVVSNDPLADAKELSGLADWCGRYSPWTSYDSTAGVGNAGLWLDVTGCAHLFGGEQALLADLVGRLRHLGYSAYAALADSPGAAWAIARFAPLTESCPWQIVAPGQARVALPDLSIAALRLSAESVVTLERLGFKTIGDLEAVPRAPLVARFGDELVTRLDQAMNRCREPISPCQPAAAVQTRVIFAEAISRLDDVERAIAQLVEKACADLGQLQHGARKLVLEIYCVDGKMVTLTVGTSRPVRDPHHLTRLFGENIDKLDLGFGADAMALFVTVSYPLASDQLQLKRQTRHGRSLKVLPTRKRPADDDGTITPSLTEVDVAATLDQLTDRLGNRLGANNVVRFMPQASFLPERAVAAYAPLTGPPLGSACPVSPSSDGMVGIEIPWLRGLSRPLCLFLRPEPIDAIALIPDDPPALFRWRKQLHRVTWAEGPERLSPEWWHEAGLSTMPEPLRTRDYFRVEDADGCRFWLYRNGLYRNAHAVPILAVSAREAELEKSHSCGRRKLTAVPKTIQPEFTAVQPVATAEGAPTWFVHGIFS